MNKPKDIPQKEWDEANQRASRAREYAAMFPIRPHDLQFQDPQWQWENRAKPFDTRRLGSNDTDRCNSRH